MCTIRFVSNWLPSLLSEFNFVSVEVFALCNIKLMFSGETVTHAVKSRYLVSSHQEVFPIAYFNKYLSLIYQNTISKPQLFLLGINSLFKASKYHSGNLSNVNKTSDEIRSMPIPLKKLEAQRCIVLNVLSGLVWF